MFHIFIVLWVYFPSLQIKVPWPQAQRSPGTAPGPFQPQPPQQDGYQPTLPQGLRLPVHSSSASLPQPPGAFYTGDALTQGHSLRPGKVAVLLKSIETNAKSHSK